MTPTAARKECQLGTLSTPYLPTSLRPYLGQVELWLQYDEQGGHCEEPGWKVLKSSRTIRFFSDEAHAMDHKKSNQNKNGCCDVEEKWLGKMKNL